MAESKPVAKTRAKKAAPKKAEPLQAINGGPPKLMTKARAAARVMRQVPVVRNGKPTGDLKPVPVKPSEVLDFKDYGDRVVVVTTDGRKLVSQQ